jgi:hypothetical protein
MSSSISSSDAASRGWGRWLAVFLGALVATGGLLFLFLLLIDPYDSGRYVPSLIAGVNDGSPRTANASRGRDPSFDSAIIGNSSGQLLRPATLSQLTGLRFVQLTVPGTGPREQLVLLRWFVRHHPHIGALAFVTDSTWCTGNPALPITHPFPFWLYSDSHIEYLSHLFSSRALGRSLRRIRLGLGSRSRSAPDGYWDYELLGHGDFRPDALIPDDFAVVPDEAKQDFPAIDQLRAFIAGIGDTPVVIVMPPLMASNLPRPGTRGAARLQACKAALAQLVAGRARSNFLDFRIDDPVTRDRNNFMDSMHYRARIARKIEQHIADSLRPGNAVPAKF